ncbi:MAG TPA: response regulator [Candidatus Eisenbacteria bacterium]
MVLIVEDEKLLARTLSRAMKDAGYRTVTVGSAELAEKQLGASQFDLMVIDNRLPRETGLELLSKVRGANQELKVILMTAFDSKDVKSEARKLKVDRYLKKPFDLERILAHVSELIGGPEAGPAD